MGRGVEKYQADPFDFIPPLSEQISCDGGIDAAAHSDNDTLGYCCPLHENILAEAEGL
jgi:hypothetical protein